MKFTLGKKMQMTQLWDNDKVLAVTPVLAGPCTITQVKTQATDKYSALQIAFGVRKSKNIKKPQLGHFKKAGVAPMYVREFRTENDNTAKVGDVISLSTFSAGDVISVTGTSKGRGFQGVVKRHHFAGGRKSHGNKDQLRMPGSIGPKGPAHVFKGMKMGGRMGNERVTITNLTIHSVDVENNILYIA
ncbi:50S ribosomal protein L3, partial [Patescibacteria group bacterium]|nr:50S ribosomal protein L3 [Patescibacteria group bacterium]